jgi:hypothetical protein
MVGVRTVELSEDEQSHFIWMGRIDCVLIGLPHYLIDRTQFALCIQHGWRNLSPIEGFNKAVPLYLQRDTDGLCL